MSWWGSLFPGGLKLEAQETFLQGLLLVYLLIDYNRVSCFTFYPFICYKIVRSEDCAKRQQSREVGPKTLPPKLSS